MYPSMGVPVSVLLTTEALGGFVKKRQQTINTANNDINRPTYQQYVITTTAVNC